MYFLLFCPHSLRFAQMKHLTNTYCEWMTPNYSDVAAHKHGLNTWDGSDRHQSDRIHLLSTWSRNSLHHSCLNYAWSLSGIKKISLSFPFSIFHFPFSLFGKSFTTLQTSPSKDQRMSNIWQLPSIKPTPATKRDHHSHHLHYIHRYILQAVARHSRHFECSWGWLITYYLILSNTICRALLPLQLLLCNFTQICKQKIRACSGRLPRKKG